jgi:hypothetical protein
MIHAYKLSVYSRIRGTLGAIIMAPENWSMYRVKYVVQAMQLAERCCITLPESGPQIGESGDYLVRYSDGTQRIVQHHVFEGIYTRLEEDSTNRKQLNCSIDEQAINSRY